MASGGPIQTGNGATVVFTVGSFTPLIVSIGGLRRTIEMLDFSNLATADYMAKVVADLAELEAISMRIRYDSGTACPLGTRQTTPGIVVTFPEVGAESGGNAASFQGSGAITAHEMPTLENNVVAESTIDVEFDHNAANSGALFTITAGSTV